ncbi:MAG: hypothetical protein IJG00_02010 [Clostridia bacterium]|nr:hypothetical protein [Clostridia bacterium]MBR0423849.1 hypothetical protein [Clostridia bacterium]
MTNNENLLKLIEEVNSDPEKIEQFSKKDSPQELYDYCISIVPGYTYEEFTEFMMYLADLISKDLSEDELNNITGGTSKPWLNSAAQKFKLMLEL